MNIIEVLKQALEALENAKHKFHGKSLEWLEWNNDPAITNLTTAIEQMEKAEPVAEDVREIVSNYCINERDDSSRVV